MNRANQFDRCTLVHHGADSQRPQLLALGIRREPMVRNHNDWLNSGAPEVSQNLNTMLVGEIVVEHEQVESAGGKHLEGCFVTHRDRRIVTFVLEDARLQPSSRRVRCDLCSHRETGEESQE